MKKGFSVIVLLSVLSACDNDNEVSKNANADNTGQTQTAAIVDDTVDVFLSTGQTQCANDGLTIAQTASTLTDADVNIIESSCAIITGAMYAAVCGGANGNINIHTIPSVDLINAKNVGFSEVSSLEFGYSEVSCEDDNNENLPTNEFAEEYSFSDFNLSDTYTYWEIRRGNMSNQEDGEDQVIRRFDDASYSNLTIEQLNLLNSADTNKGYDSLCEPGHCPIYGVALFDNSMFIIESTSDLISFFGDIDTEAELSYLLSRGHSSVEFFQKNQLGYRVIVKWDSLCQLRGENLIQVYKDGTTELIKALSTEEYYYCV